tara:strand:+ start:1300 stop:1677 length:378 start_codon:yes stop_codon:yes gene_type:complete
MSDVTDAKLDALSKEIATWTGILGNGVKENKAAIRKHEERHEEDVKALHGRINKTREQVDEHNVNVMSAIGDLRRETTDKLNGLRQDAIRAASKPWQTIVLLVGTVTLTGMIGWVIRLLTVAASG